MGAAKLFFLICKSKYFEIGGFFLDAIGVVEISIIILFIILYCFISFIYFKKGLKNEIDWRFVVLVALIFILGAILIFDIFSRTIDKSNIIRNITMVCTAIIAAISLFTTVYFTNRTAKSNLETYHSNLLMNMMKNNYTLIEEASDSIKKVLEELNLKFKYNGYVLDRAVKKMNEQIRLDITQSEIDLTIDGILTKYPQLPSKDDIHRFKKIKSNDQILRKFLITYYSHTNKQFYNTLDEGEKKKTYDQKFFDVLNKTPLFIKLKDCLEKENCNYFIDKKLTYEQTVELCNEIYNSYYIKVGHFLRNSHRVVKMINKFYPDLENRKEYLGILRSQYSEEVLLFIYYNCVFTDKGIGFARQLVGSDFFGDSDDFTDKKTIHFRDTELIFKSLDLDLIQEFFVSEKMNVYENHKSMQSGLKKYFDNKSADVLK